MADNPDRALIAEMMAYGYSDVAVDTNPVFADLGARIITAARGKIALRFSVGKRARQGDGIIHGGVISTMLDGGMAFAVLSMLDAGESAATISLTVNFLGAAGEGECEVGATVERIGQRVAFTRATLTSDTGKPVATATAAFAVLRARS